MNKAATDVAQALTRLSELTIFELRGEWRRLHRMPPQGETGSPRGPAHARVENVEIVEADPAALGPGAGFRQIPTR